MDGNPRGSSRTLGLGLATLVTSCAVASPSAAKAGTVPKQLLATFVRTIPAKELAQTGFPQAYGRWSLTVKKDRTLFLQGPAGFSSYQHLTATSATRLTVRDDFCTPRSGTYRWKVTGKSLTLTSVKDRCRDRSAVLTGVWKRR
jgi:hypothetical protein